MFIYKISTKDYGIISNLPTSALSDHEANKNLMQQWEDARAEIRNLSHFQGHLLPFSKDPSVFQLDEILGFIFTDYNEENLFVAVSKHMAQFGQPIK